MQIRLDQELRAAAETDAIDLQVLQHALDVVARLGERDLLDPVDRVDLGIAWIAILGDPLLHTSAASIVAGEGEDVGTAVVGDQVAELGGAELYIVALVAQEPLLVEGGAELLRHITPGGRRHLHQSHGARARDRPRVERALLARDGVGHRRFDRRTDGTIFRKPVGRERVVLERQPLSECALAEQQRAARILISTGNLAERGERGGIAAPFAEIGEGAGDEIALIDGVEKLDGAGDLEWLASGVRRGAQHHVLMAEPGAGDLAVIRRGIARRRLVMGARLGVASECLRGPALPIARAGLCDRVVVALADPGEMRERRGWVVQEAQRDPAGGELALGAVVLPAGNRRLARDPVGGLEVAEVEQLARDHTPLDPPLVGVDRLAVIGRDRQDQLGGFQGLLAAAQELDAAEDHADVVLLHVRRKRVEQRLGIGGFLDHGNARFGDRRSAAAGATRCAECAVGILGMEPHVHACLVIGGRDQVAEYVERLGLEIGGEGVVAPGVAHQGLRAGAIALQQQCARERKLTLGAEGTLLSKEGAHERWIGTVGPQRRLGAPPQQADGRPARILADEGQVAVELDAAALVVTQDCPFDELATDRIGDRLLELGGLIDTALRAAETASLIAAMSAADVSSVEATAKRTGGAAGRATATAAGAAGIATPVVVAAEVPGRAEGTGARGTATCFLWSAGLVLPSVPASLVSLPLATLGLVSAALASLLFVSFAFGLALASLVLLSLPFLAFASVLVSFALPDWEPLAGFCVGSSGAPPASPVCSTRAAIPAATRPANRLVETRLLTVWSCAALADCCHRPIYSIDNIDEELIAARLP